MDQLSLGVMARSLKENERRLPIHPQHLGRIPDDLRGRIFLERGYGERLRRLRRAARARGSPASAPASSSSHECDVILQPKPLLSDIAELRDGQVLWGWPHCVQDEELTQVAIDRQLTLIAFEAMNHWHRDGSFSLHVFHKNNELAGYCSVLHAMQIAGSPATTAAPSGRRDRLRRDRPRGGDRAERPRRPRRRRPHPPRDARSPRRSTRRTMVHFDTDDTTARVSHALTDDGRVPLAEFLAEHDIIVNCVLQDTDAPLMFLTERRPRAHAAPGTLIVDVSCDEGMGFSWARPTTFTEPDLRRRRQRALLRRRPQPVLPVELRHLGDQRGAAALPADRARRAASLGGDPTIRRAIEIRDGVIQNPAILSFQGRSPKHPHWGPVAT